MTGGIADNAPREAPAYYDVEGGTTFTTMTMEGGGLRVEEEEGGGGTVVWTATSKETEEGIGRWAAGAPPSSASPPWRWSVHHLGTPAGDAAGGGDAGPSSRDGEGVSAARRGTTATRDNEGLLPGPFKIIRHGGSLMVMDGEGRHECNSDEP